MECPSQGNPIALVPDWTDILDLKFEGNEKTLWPELIDTLKFWCEQGVDGFRTDVACCIPMEFWYRAKSTIDLLLNLTFDSSGVKLEVVYPR